MPNSVITRCITVARSQVPPSQQQVCHMTAQANFLANHIGGHRQRRKRIRQQHQHRCMSHFGGGTRAEEFFISSTFRKLETKNPKIIIHCERAQLVGCNLLPRPAQNIIDCASIRFRVITHADTVSHDVLKHQIAFVEEQERRAYPDSEYPAAVFAMNLSNAANSKEKEMKPFVNAIFGASSLMTGRSPILVCGIPNSGKSSLILAITRQRTLRVRKKQEHHLPTVSTQAGCTLNTKRHVLEFPDSKEYVTFMDSPGLRPRLQGLNPDTIRLLLASKAVEPFKGYTQYTGKDNEVLLRLLLQAANNYTDVNYAVGKKLHERRKTGSSLDIDLPSPPLPEYALALGLTDRTTDPSVFIDACYKIDVEQIPKDPLYLVRKWQRGDFGSWMFTPYRQDVLTDRNMEELCLLSQKENAPVIYCNQAAYAYIEKAPAFASPPKKVFKPAVAAEKRLDSKVGSCDSKETANGPESTKKGLTDKEIEELLNIWS